MTSTSLKHTATRPACSATPSMWRYANVLPDADPVTLGEGWTPMLPSRRYPALLIKEEANNPTGSFKARGMSMAVTMARHYGLKKLAAPSAGNAASALAAYAAAAGIEAHIFMPRDVPMANYLEGVAYGAHVTLVDGLISDCGRLVAEGAKREGWFDVSTLKEPFRVEGKKTMGYELVEQLGWRYPDAVFYPTGGGVGLIGMWKAFEEMEQLGWVTGQRPKDDRRPGLRLRARRPRLERRRGRLDHVRKRRHLRRRPPRPQALRRFAHPRNRPRIRRHGRRPARRNRSSPHCSTGPATKACCSAPKEPAPRQPTITCSQPASSRPKTASSSSTPAPA